MVSKSKSESSAKGKKGKVKVLNLKKETVKSLSSKESSDVKGGAMSELTIIGPKSKVRATSTL